MTYDHVYAIMIYDHVYAIVESALRFIAYYTSDIERSRFDEIYRANLDWNMFSESKRVERDKILSISEF